MVRVQAEVVHTERTCWAKGRLEPYHKAERTDSVELEQTCLGPECDEAEGTDRGGKKY